MYSLGRLLTIEQAAEKLHVSVRTVRSWRYKRQIPFTRIARRIYLDAGVVEKLLDANAVAALASSQPPDSKPTGQGGVATRGDDK